MRGRSAQLDTDRLCELATEAPDGPLETILTLINALSLRHYDDDTTLAALTAVEAYHLSNLLDGLE